MIKNMLKLLKRKKQQNKPENFLSYSSAKKTQIIKKAVEEANNEQLKLEKTYKKQYQN